MTSTKGNQEEPLPPPTLAPATAAATGDGLASMNIMSRLSLSAHRKSQVDGNDKYKEDDSDDSDDDVEDNSIGDSEDDVDHSISPSMQPQQLSAYDLMMVKREKHRLCTFRVLVIGMLVMTAAVTASAYYLLGREEYKNFEDAYYQFARSLADASLDQQESLRDSLKSLANEITAYGELTTTINGTTSWPYVVLPQFESFAMGYFDHSDGEFVGVNNLVYHEDREEYTEWANANYQDWILEGHMLKYGHDNFLDTDPSLYHPYISKKMPDSYPPDDARPYYSPRTSQSPPMRSYGPSMNLNIASIGSNGDVIDGVLLLRNETLVTALKPFNALPPEEHQGFHTDAEEVHHPHSFLYHPVYERVKDSTSKIVATLTSSVAWDASMLDLLPETVKGIRCVVKNNCDQSFTYEVVGPEAFYKGDGDLHDTEYDEYELFVDLALHTHPDFPSTPGHCQYSMSIYPTDEFKADYTTKLPGFFALIVAASFTGVALVFFIYDFFVRKRNAELSATAAKSNMLVESLFPGEIKDRLLEQQDISGVQKNSRHLRNKKNDFKQEDNNKITTTKIQDSRPLAAVYEDTTVMFADLEGFTQWSNTRTPVEVFELLETLYSTFDGLARKRSVFKVETIGDCYVAATGIPDQQPDHAMRMCRFVSECMHVMSTLTADLAESLGEDTVNLKLRAGMHSGAVTGGVLRGDKSRFQLFGDTMNTASRMESNGVAGRIHVSESTANLLMKVGKQSWLTARPDKIVAKGKGEMDTYFVVVPIKRDKSGKSASTDDYDNSSVVHENDDENTIDNQNK